MDISVFLGDVKLNIRTAVIIEMENGYIFEKDEFYVIVGGRGKSVGRLYFPHSFLPLCPPFFFLCALCVYSSPYSLYLYG